MQVLIFDADPTIDQSILQYLHLRNYDVTIVRTAGEALDLIHRTEFDCILLDVSSTANITDAGILVGNREDSALRFCSYLTPTGINVRVWAAKERTCSQVWLAGPL